MATDHNITPAVDELVNAMLTSCGQLAAVFAHMERHRNSAPEVPPPAEVLSDLMRGMVEPLRERYGEADVATATRVLRAATEVIGEELFLVDLEEPA